MTEIPEDIREKAKAVVQTMFADTWRSIDANAIARAILAERERCAKMAEGCMRAYGDDDTFWEGVNFAAVTIAADIRSGDQ